MNKSDNCKVVSFFKYQYTINRNTGKLSPICTGSGSEQPVAFHERRVVITICTKDNTLPVVHELISLGTNSPTLAESSGLVKFYLEVVRLLRMHQAHIACQESR